MSLHIVPIFTGVLPGSEQSIQKYLTGFGQKISVHTYMWAILGGPSPIIVDVGIGSPELVMRRHGRELQQQHSPVDTLRAAGVDPLAVEIVIQTHLHWDHVLGLELNLFPNATIWVQQEELRYAAAPIPPHVPLYKTPVLQSIIPVFESDHQIEPVIGDWRPAPGIEVWLTPGHTPGLQSVLVSTSRGTYAIASDNVALKDQMTGPSAVSWIPSGVHVNLNDAYRSLQRLRSGADFILPSHCGSVLDHARYPSAEHPEISNSGTK